jgi:hypothetical protein
MFAGCAVLLGSCLRNKAGLSRDMCPLLECTSQARANDLSDNHGTGNYSHA